MAQRILCSFTFLALAASAIAADSEGPHPWHKYGIGTYVKYQNFKASSTRKPAIYTYELKEKRADGSVVITHTSSIAKASGEYFDIVRDKEYQYSPAGDREQKWRKLTEREKIKTKAGTFDCLVQNFGNAEKKKKFCYSEKVPGEFVMSATYDKNGEMVSGMLLIEFKFK